MTSKQALRAAIKSAGALFLCAACATQPEKGPPLAEAVPAPAEKPAEPAPAPTPLPPHAPTAEERQRAEQLANESVGRLQAGDSAAGRSLLEQALALDPKNELARLMMRQVTADPVAELGTVNFAYTIERDETLAKLAQRFLGDRFLFYILARYNDIAQPNQIHVGQVIRIPGTAPSAKTPPPPRVPTPAPTGPPESARPAAAAAPADDLIAKRLADGREEERKGNFDGALAAYEDVLHRDPTNAEAKQRRDAVRTRLIDRYYADGMTAFAHQDLDKAIAAWDRVLQLDPNHQNAKLKRQQALDLRDKLKRFETKG